MKKDQRLDEFIDREINKTESFIMSTRDESYISACKTKRHLEAIKKDFCDKQKGYCEMEKYLGLSSFKIEEGFLAFVKKIAKFYAIMPLTETESSVRAPFLPKRKYITEEEILTFLNEIYQEELKSDKKIVFNKGNVKIFKNSLFHRQFSSQCVPYHNYYNHNSMLILNKYLNINDLIITSCKATELIPELEFRPFDNMSNIITFYMKYKSLRKVNDEYNQIDAKNFYLLALDNIIIEARQILIMLKTKDWTDLSKYQQSCILNFIDNVLGATLAHVNNISLKEMIDSLNQNENTFNMDNFNLDNTIILNTAKELQYTYKRK